MQDGIENLTEKYRMTFDYHTHTIYSSGIIRPHGKGTPEENVKVAIEKGLKGIAISDHGPGHLTYGIKRNKLPELRREIERLKKVYPQIEIYMSVEANTVMSDNFLDVMPGEMKVFDFVNAGYHFGVRNANVARNFAVGTGFGKKSADMLMEYNTRLVTGAVLNNEIKILTHPGDKVRVDMKEVAEACEKMGTWMEVNNSHGHLDVDELEICKEYDVNFVIGSDAHVPEKVGSFEKALARLLYVGIGSERIVNIEER